MKTAVVEKIQELEYDEVLTLGVIELNDDLTEVFKTEINMPFNLLYKIQKEGKLNEPTKVLLKMIFEKLILTKQSFINQYMKLGNIDNTIYDVEPIEELKLNDDVLPIGFETEQSEIPSVVVPDKISDKTTTNEKKLPRRYGKQQIQKDILNQGFKATPLQLAGLKLNDLKNLNVNLMNKFIRENHLGTNVLTDADALEIIATVNMVERKLEKILKKK